MPDQTLTVSWDDPAALAAGAQSSSGLEFLQAIAAGELPRAPIQALVGFELVEVEEGRVVFAGEPGEQHSGGGLLAQLPRRHPAPPSEAKRRGGAAGG